MVSPSLVAGVCSSRRSPASSLRPSAGCERCWTYTCQCVSRAFIAVEVTCRRLPEAFLSRGIHSPSRCGPRSPLACVVQHPSAPHQESSAFRDRGPGLCSALPTCLKTPHRGCRTSLLSSSPELSLSLRRLFRSPSFRVFFTNLSEQPKTKGHHSPSRCHVTEAASPLVAGLSVLHTDDTPPEGRGRLRSAQHWHAEQ